MLDAKWTDTRHEPKRHFYGADWSNLATDTYSIPFHHFISGNEAHTDKQT